MPRRLLRSPMMLPMYSSGVITSTSRGWSPAEPWELPVTNVEIFEIIKKQLEQSGDNYHQHLLSYLHLKVSWKEKRYVNPDPKSKSCDLQAAVFIFMSRRLILNCLNYRICCIYIRAAFNYIISVEKVSFSIFLPRNGMAGPYWNMAKKWQCYWEN